MRIRRWPVILGSTLLFGIGTASCSTSPGPVAEDTAQSAASDTESEAQEDTEGRIPEQTSDAIEPPKEDAVAIDTSSPTDTADVDASSSEDASEPAMDTTMEEDVQAADTTDAEVINTTDGTVAAEDTAAPQEDTAEADAAPLMDAVAETDVEESLPQAGDPCEGDVFGAGGGICLGDPPEPYLICDWEGVYIPAKEFAGFDLCQCDDTNDDGAYEIICASPGFVGIAKSGRDRTQFKSLRRA